MEDALRTLIMGLPGLAGWPVSWLIRPPGGVLPALVLNVISDTRSGFYDQTHGPQTTRVQCDAWGKAFIPVRDATNAIGSALHLWKGTIGATRFLGIYAEDGDSGFEETSTGVIQRSRIDLMVHHTAAEE